MEVKTTFSKGDVNRAGQHLRELATGVRAGNVDVVDALQQGRYDQAITAVDAWRSRHAKPLARVNAGLRYYIRQVSPVDPQVSQRLKRLSTIIDKLAREPGMELSRMEDIGGVRVILPSQDQVDDIVDRLDRAARWKIRRLRRYVDGADPGPKRDGYRAVHAVVVKDGCFIEVQFRTPWQDAWAQSVEQDTRRLRSGLKFGEGPDDLREYYRLVSEFFALREVGVEAPQELMEDIAKSYAATRRYFPDVPPMT
jgi:ppGpp synthetase/RelA/SpoT-type nucleotidyltranferase